MLSCLLDNQFIGTKGEYGEYFSYFKYENIVCIHLFHYINIKKEK